MALKIAPERGEFLIKTAGVIKRMRLQGHLSVGDWSKDIDREFGSLPLDQMIEEYKYKSTHRRAVLDRPKDGFFAPWVLPEQDCGKSMGLDFVNRTELSSSQLKAIIDDRSHLDDIRIVAWCLANNKVAANNRGVLYELIARIRALPRVRHAQELHAFTRTYGVCVHPFGFETPRRFKPEWASKRGVSVLREREYPRYRIAYAHYIMCSSQAMRLLDWLEAAKPNIVKAQDVYLGDDPNAPEFSLRLEGVRRALGSYKDFMMHFGSSVNEGRPLVETELSQLKLILEPLIETLRYEVERPFYYPPQLGEYDPGSYSKHVDHVDHTKERQAHTLRVRRHHGTKVHVPPIASQPARPMILASGFKSTVAPWARGKGSCNTARSTTPHGNAAPEMCNPYMCDCGLEVPDGHEEAHTSGRRHRNFMLRQRLTDHDGVQVDSLMQVRCVCGAEVAVDNIPAHVAGRKHINAMADRPRYCELCKCNISPGSGSWDAHVSGRQHLSNLVRGTHPGNDQLNGANGTARGKDFLGFQEVLSFLGSNRSIPYIVLAGYAIHKLASYVSFLGKAQCHQDQNRDAVDASTLTVPILRVFGPTRVITIIDVTPRVADVVALGEIPPPPVDHRHDPRLAPAFPIGPPPTPLREEIVAEEPEDDQMEMLRELVLEESLFRTTPLPRVFTRRCRHVINRYARCVADHEQCPICLSDFAHGDRVFFTNCEHFVHQDCFERELVSCPICRHELTTLFRLRTQLNGQHGEYTNSDDLAAAAPVPPPPPVPFIRTGVRPALPAIIPPAPAGHPKAWYDHIQEVPTIGNGVRYFVCQPGNIDTVLPGRIVKYHASFLQAVLGRKQVSYVRLPARSSWRRFVKHLFWLGVSGSLLLARHMQTIVRFVRYGLPMEPHIKNVTVVNMDGVKPFTDSNLMVRLAHFRDELMSRIRSSLPVIADPFASIRPRLRSGIDAVWDLGLNIKKAVACMGLIALRLRDRYHNKTPDNDYKITFEEQFSWWDVVTPIFQIGRFIGNCFYVRQLYRLVYFIAWAWRPLALNLSWRLGGLLPDGEDLDPEGLTKANILQLEAGVDVYVFRYAPSAYIADRDLRDPTIRDQGVKLVAEEMRKILTVELCQVRLENGCLRVMRQTLVDRQEIDFMSVFMTRGNTNMNISSQVKLIHERMVSNLGLNTPVTSMGSDAASYWAIRATIQCPLTENYDAQNVKVV